ncbi:hypothetical protein A2767_01995 [Candidatus Roizmanbacteria bacterium RIFCSPHIGHO2_01_FULL_35_10]|uniref:Uncharacterized protein n=1 Tax=Candidatus Roizmanbacteria bacterium RIFCSPLOWO2_01_FULL_35_13 TaxID=1802055 RepID=A0A1F7I7I4_9BACT|nr:MAG: hypothetical protein A2767_01995 [Candidatus Roizmanbacteria bacterium RIFCSPHIGHO2_01_FULL_35_10]OGK39232.1 MAG: hypothetical protein A3A74_07410 [Candidatus Roizmanbacteria bacterium RIFCSPLOWO2_01_FULL_35_13]
MKIWQKTHVKYINNSQAARLFPNRIVSIPDLRFTLKVNQFKQVATVTKDVFIDLIKFYLYDDGRYYAIAMITDMSKLPTDYDISEGNATKLENDIGYLWPAWVHFAKM